MLSIQGTISIERRGALWYGDFSQTPEGAAVRLVMRGRDWVPLPYAATVPVEVVCKEVSKNHRDFLVIGRRG
jgi:hypothetical protein